MPTGTAVKASTQDNTSGTAVAQATSEVTSSGAMQTMVQEGNKTTYAETQQLNDALSASITAANAPTGGDLTTGHFAGSAGANLFDLGNALSTQMRATCDTANAVLTGFLVFYDGSNVAIGKSETIAFTADGTLRLGNGSGNFVAGRVLVDNGAARKARWFTSSVSTGTWAVYARPV